MTTLLIEDEGRPAVLTIKSIILTRRFPQWLWIVLLVRCISGRKKVCSFCVDRVEHIDYKDLPAFAEVRERAR